MVRFLHLQNLLCGLVCDDALEEDVCVVVYEELGHLIRIAGGQVGKEGGATGGR